MASPIFTHPKITLKQIFVENTNLNAFLFVVALLNAAKSIKVRSKMNFKILNFTCILSISQSASQPAIRPGFTSAMALHNKGNHVEFMTLLF